MTEAGWGSPDSRAASKAAKLSQDSDSARCASLLARFTTITREAPVLSRKDSSAEMIAATCSLEGSEPKRSLSGSAETGVPSAGSSSPGTIRSS